MTIYRPTRIIGSKNRYPPQGYTGATRAAPWEDSAATQAGLVRQIDRPGRKLSGTGREASGVVGGNRLFAAGPLPTGGKHAGGLLSTAGG